LLPGASHELEFATDTKRRDKKHASNLSPYPPELIPFEPLDGPDTRYSQLHKPFGSMPYKEAGINGFTPPQPFAVASHFARCGDFKDFHWPTLAELNDDLDQAFAWRDDDERIRYFSHDVVDEEIVMYHGPPPAPATVHQPAVPSVSALNKAILDLTDRLFFVSHSRGNPSIRKWRLVRVALADSTAMSPSCLQDGKLIVEFYILHHEDVRHNATNQRYWLQYHPFCDITTPTSSTMTHMIRPYDTSKYLAARSRLVPFRRWLNLTHSNTYLHGPFEFATINGRQTHDRVAQTDWDILSTHASQFSNPVPRFDLPSYSIHIDLSVHVIVHNPTQAAALCSAVSIDTTPVFP
jgi:hypothetical protein